MLWVTMCLYIDYVLFYFDRVYMSTTITDTFIPLCICVIPYVSVRVCYDCWLLSWIMLLSCFYILCVTSYACMLLSCYTADVCWLIRSKLGARLKTSVNHELWRWRHTEFIICVFVLPDCACIFVVLILHIPYSS